MNAVTPPTQPPSRSSVKRLRECNTLGQAFECDELRLRIEQSMPKHLDADRMLRAFVQASTKQPDLFKCEWRQVIGACLTLSQIGLEPNTPLNHAYMIPFKKKAYNPETRRWDRESYDLQIILGYPGLAELMWRTGIVSNIRAGVAYEDEIEVWYGTGAQLIHRPKFKTQRTEAPDVAYAHVSFALKGGATGQAFEVVPWHEVLRIRDRSQAYQSALYAKHQAEQNNKPPPKAWTEAPWNRDLIPMGSKTAFRRLWKMMPKSPDMIGLALASDIEERQEAGRTLDFGSVIDGDPAEGPADAPVDQIEHKVYVDPLAAHGMRQADPVPNQTQGKQAQSAPNAAAAAVRNVQAQTQPVTAAQPVEPVEEWPLYDASGDISEICPDAEIWLERFLDIYRSTPADMFQALHEFNDATIVAVAALGGSYLKVLADNGFTGAAAPAGQPPAVTDQSASRASEPNPGLWMPPQLPPLPIDRHQAPDQKKIGTLMETALGMCESGEQIDAFLGAMKPDWCNLGNGARLVVMRAIAARKMQLGIPPAEA